VGQGRPRQIAEGRPLPGTGYSRSRWQTDAAGFWRSSGDRVLDAGRPAQGLPFDQVYQRFRGFSYATIYDHEHHVGLTESMEQRWALPDRFRAAAARRAGIPTCGPMLRGCSAPTRCRAAKGREQHLCPLPFDIVDRAIAGWSNPGELVFDPFGGLMTVPLRAVKLGRRGCATELNPGLLRRWRAAAARAGCRQGDGEFVRPAG
jgi:hypothetical protein